jgi:hypothetical protein
MPGRKGKSAVGRNIKEVHAGKTYARTKAKFGKKKADRQAIAIAMSEAGVGRRKKRKAKKRANRSENEQ